MRGHIKGCNGIREFIEQAEGKPESRSKTDIRGDLFAIYIFKQRKWVKIGEYCTACGFHLDLEKLKELFGEITSSKADVYEIDGRTGEPLPKPIPFTETWITPNKFQCFFRQIASSNLNPLIPSTA